VVTEALLDICLSCPMPYAPRAHSGFFTQDRASTLTSAMRKAYICGTSCSYW
jgi:hypothetical protein